jgi:hypothetical protein
MESAISDIRSGLKTGSFINEASISQGIVLRLLNALSWNTFDPSIVWPEYALKGRRVDFALCHPPRRPVVFIEVKQVGQGAEAERQLFEYAFHVGVQLAILTTGQEWHFFLPAERGDYDERRVYLLDLVERSIEESVDRLRCYLDYDEVISGRAIDSARAEYGSLAKAREIQRTLPQAWKKLVEDSDELLIELLADKTESLCGFRPDPDTVATFLLRNFSSAVTQRDSLVNVRTSRAVSTPAPTSKPELGGGRASAATSLGFVLHGQQFVGRSARDVLIQVFQKLHEADPTFLERFAARTTTGTKRPHIARTREALFPKNEQLAGSPSASRELFPGSGWWIDVNVSRQGIERIIQLACEVAGMRYGVDLTAQVR